MYLFYPLLSSLLYIISFPYNISGFIAYIALVPLLLTFRFNDKRKVFAGGAVFGTAISAYFSIPLFHSLTINPESGIMLPLLLVFITVILPGLLTYGVFSLICHWSGSQYLIIRLLFPASLWISIDYLRSFSPFILPWGLAGYTQVYSPLIQSADIAGIHGVTFIIILSNTFIAKIIASIKAKYSASSDKLAPSETYRQQKPLYLTLVLLIILTINITYGIIKKERVTCNEKDSGSIKYLIVQGNSGSVDRWNESSSIARYQVYTGLTLDNIKKPDLILWPETVLNSSDSINYDIMSGVSSVLNEQTFFMTGAIRRDNKNNTYNSIFVFKKGGLDYIYDKRILFPYSEQPFLGMSSGRFLNSPEKFTSGKKQGLYRTGDFLTGFSICFESIYPSIIRRLASSGASLIVNVANDSWFGNSSVPYLQMYAVIARAVENRISIIRAANSGISFAVSPAGETHSVTQIFTLDTAQGELPIIKKRSFYSVTGDIVVIFAIIILLSAVMLGEIKINKYGIN